MAENKKSLTAAVSKEIKSKFDLDGFKKKKMLITNTAFKEQKWLPLSPAFQRVTSVPGIPLGHIVILRGHTDTGKAQPLYSTVYTPEGPKTMGEIQEGDLVIGEDGKPIKVLKTFPQGFKPTYRITFSDGFTVDCCDEHLWKVKTIANRLNEYWNLKDPRNPNKIEDYEKWEILTTKELMENLYWKNGVYQVPNYKMPICDPVEFTKKNLPIDPYLLGVLIGDGGLSSKGKVSITNIDEYILDRVKDIVERDFEGYTLKQISDTISYNISNINPLKRDLNPVNEAVKLLKLNTISEHKFIPEVYKYSDISDRIDLLNGLMDTDGTLDKNGTHIYYSTTSKKLAYDVAELVQSLGCVASVSFRPNNFKGCWKVVINQNNSFPVFSLPRKQMMVVDKTSYKTLRSIYNIDYIGETEQKCILVDSDSHLYLTDNFTVTHNTTALLEAASAAQKAGILPVFIITEMKWNWDFARKLGLQVEEEKDKEGNILGYKGFFIYVDRETLSSIEDVAGFIGDLMDEQKKGNLPYDLLFLWDSIGSIPCEMSLKSNKNNNEWNAGAMSTQFGNHINQKIVLSRKESYPYTNTLCAINKVWTAKPDSPMGQPRLMNKGGWAMWFDATFVITFGNVSNSGTSKIKAIKDGKTVEFAKRTNVQIEKNHINGITTRGRLVMTSHGFIDDDDKAIKSYKEEHSKEWSDILGGADFEIVEENVEFEPQIVYDKEPE